MLSTLTRDASKALRIVAERIGARVEGSTATGRGITFVLRDELGPGKLAEILNGLRSELENRGWRVVGAGLRLEDGTWIAEIIVAAAPGKLVSIEIVNPGLELRRSASTWLETISAGLDELGNVNDGERPYLAAAMYMVDPRPEHEVLEHMAGLVGEEMAERIAALVWRIAFGEGFSLEEWAELLKSQTILKPWIPIWRFQELAMKGLRERRSAEPADLDPRFVLRAACKLLGFG